MNPMTGLMGLRAELLAVEEELGRADDLGDAAAVVRLRRVLAPRQEKLRAAIAQAERLDVEVNR